MISAFFTPGPLIYPLRCVIMKYTTKRKGQIMAKKKGKNRNYQTPARVAEQRAAEAEAEKKRPHIPTKTEKHTLRLKARQIICIVLVALLVLTSGTTAVIGLLSAGGTQSAADVDYPPLFLYEGTYYMVTSEQTTTRPEGGEVIELTAETTGDQDTFPVQEGSCNFGGGTVPFLWVDGTIYCCTEEGIYLTCTPFTSIGEEDEEDGESESESSASESGASSDTGSE